MKTDYRVVVYPIETEEGVQWAAEYPDLKGCAGGGYTAVEAIEEAEENKAVYLQELKEMGKAIPIPSNNSQSYSGRFTVRISKTAHKKIAEFSEREGISINAFVSEAINQRIGECINLGENIDKLSALVQQTDNLISNTRSLMDESSYQYLIESKGINNYKAFSN